MPSRHRRKQTKTHRLKKTLLLTILVLIVVAVSLVAPTAWRIYTRAEELYASLLNLERVLSNPPQQDNQETLEQLTILVAETHADAVALREAARPLLPYAPSLHQVPSYGPDIAAAEPMLDVLIHTSAALTETLSATQPLLPLASNPEEIPDSKTIQHIREARPGFERAHLHTGRAMDALAHIPVDDLSPSLRSRVQRIEPLLPLLDSGLELTLAASDVAIALSPAYSEWQRSSTINATLVADLHTARPALDQSLHTLRQTSQQWEQIPLESIPEPLRSRVQRLISLFPLVETSLETSLNAEELLYTLSPLLETGNASRPLTVSLTTNLLAAQPLLQQARQDVFRINDQLAQTDLLSPEQTSQVVETLALIEDMLDLALITPALLGAEEKREYLLITQNPDEMRATGGFMSNIGILSTERGHLDVPSLVNSNVDSQRLRDGPYIRGPDPLRRYMGIHQWAFRDANWSPSFPTAARAARYLYNISQGDVITNVIAFDPFLLKLLLEATGPMQVEAVDGSLRTISAENILDFLREQYTAGLQAGNKDMIIDPLFLTILNNILSSDPADLDALSLIQAFIQALNGHHIQLYVEDPEIAAILDRQRWDGAVRPGTDDFFMVVESNVGYTKSNASIQQSLTYTIDLEYPTSPLATLSVQYVHEGPPHNQCIPTNRRENRRISSYQEMVEWCYWNYQRVLVPIGSTLLETTGHPTPAEWLMSQTADDGTITATAATTRTMMFSTFLVVPAGEQRVSTFRYRLPPHVLTRNGETWTYHLRVQKQAGHEMIPLVVRVYLPPGASLLSTSFPPNSQEGNLLTFSRELKRDSDLVVRFHAP